MSFNISLNQKNNSAYPQIYFPGEIKAGGKKKLVVVSAYKKNSWWFLHINGSASVKTDFFRMRKLD
jgi:hypothetical protein